MELKIEGDYTVAQAAERKPPLLAALAALASGEALTLDLSGVTEIDCAGVQLLLLAQREAGHQGSKLLLQQHSPAVLDAFALLGLAGHFGAPQAAAAR